MKSERADNKILSIRNNDFQNSKHASQYQTLVPAHRALLLESAQAAVLDMLVNLGNN